MHLIRSNIQLPEAHRPSSARSQAGTGPAPPPPPAARPGTPRSRRTHTSAPSTGAYHCPPRTPRARISRTFPCQSRRRPLPPPHRASVCPQARRASAATAAQARSRNFWRFFWHAAAVPRAVVLRVAHLGALKLAVKSGVDLGLGGAVLPLLALLLSAFDVAPVALGWCCGRRSIPSRCKPSFAVCGTGRSFPRAQQAGRRASRPPAPRGVAGGQLRRGARVRVSVHDDLKF